MVIQQGDVYWAALPHPRGSGPGFRHPVVIIQNNDFNRSRIGTVVACVLTSNLERAAAPGNVALRKGEGGLPKRSVVNVSQIATLDRSELLEKLGELSKARVMEILDGVGLVLVPTD
jgi:mRNA interferase MazF